MDDKSAQVEHIVRERQLVTSKPPPPPKYHIVSVGKTEHGICDLPWDFLGSFLDFRSA